MLRTVKSTLRVVVTPATLASLVLDPVMGRLNCSPAVKPKCSQGASRNVGSRSNDNPDTRVELEVFATAVGWSVSNQ